MPTASPSFVFCLYMMMAFGECVFVSSPVDQNVLENYPMELVWLHNDTDIKACRWESDLPGTAPVGFMTYDYQTGIGGSNNVGWELLNPDDPCRGGISKKTTQQSDAKTYRMVVVTRTKLVVSNRFKVDVIRASDRSIDIEADNVRATFFPGRDLTVILPKVTGEGGTRHHFMVRLNANFPDRTSVTIGTERNNTVLLRECTMKVCEVDVWMPYEGNLNITVVVQTDIESIPDVQFQQTYEKQAYKRLTEEGNDKPKLVITLCILLPTTVICLILAVVLLTRSCRTKKIEKEVGNTIKGPLNKGDDDNSSDTVTVDDR